MCLASYQSMTLKKWLQMFPDGIPEEIEEMIFAKETREQKEILRKTLTKQGCLILGIRPV